MVIKDYLLTYLLSVGVVAQWVGRRSLAGRLSLICLIHGWQVTYLWANCPPWVSKPDQLSLSPSGVGKWVVIPVSTWIAGVKTI